MSRKYTIFLVISLISFCLSCDDINDSEPEVDYPSFIPTLEISELQDLNTRYHEENNGLICSTLNEYGYTGFSRVLFPNNENPCLNRQEVKQEILYSDEVLNTAKEAIINNSEFTGISDISDLMVEEAISLDGCTICEGPDINNVPLQWKFTFASQTVNDVSVSGTSIVVYVDVNGANRIWGNWYEGVADPGFVIEGSKAAKETVIGMNVRYANEKNQIFEQEIQSEHISGDPKLVYDLIEVEGGVEIHKAWEISVFQEDTTEIRWKIFVSTVSGDILKAELI